MTMTEIKHIYGPVKSWRSGTSLGIDPIGEISTCSFNCAYCQLGQIQKRTAEIKEYVPTEKVINDLLEAEKKGEFKFEELDVITFAGSGEPTLALNLAEMIDALRELISKRGIKVPISILTNATLFNDDEVCRRALKADLISLKLDAPTDEILKSINQPVEGVTVESIISGIKNLQSIMKENSNKLSTGSFAVAQDDKLQMQIMLMPKFLNDSSYVTGLAEIVKELGVKKIQINTPTRPKPVSKTGEYWIETRGNHYSKPAPGDCHVADAPRNDGSPDYIEFKELPVIDRETALQVEDSFRKLINTDDLEIINVYK